MPPEPSQEPLEIFEPWTVALPEEPLGASEEETAAVVASAPEDEARPEVVSTPEDEAFAAVASALEDEARPEVVPTPEDEAVALVASALEDETRPEVIPTPEDEAVAVVASAREDDVSTPEDEGRPAFAAPPEVGAGAAAASAGDNGSAPALVTTEAPTRRRHRPKPRFVAPPVRRPPPDPAKHPLAFLKRVAVAEMQSMARRLDAAQHYTTVQDLLDLPTPTLRVLIWPRPGLLDPVPGRILATMELCLNEDNGTLATSYWWGTRPGYVIPMAQAPVSELSLEWTRSQVLDFLQAVLSQL